jgi:hypothetical protein
VLSVLAQLTDNSWIVNETVRLTGGFAFVIWFATGQFVFTIGGYGPAFDRPSYYPEVPRVGFSWTPTSAVVVKGGGYFALTSSCVMAGGELEVSYDSGSVWAKLEAGVHVLVSWDPFFFDFRVYVGVAAGVEWKTFLGTVRLSFDFGVDVHVLGPKLRGTATLDLDVVKVTVRFGPTSAANTDARIGWDTFVSDYVLEPPNENGTRHALAASITAGQLLPGVAAGGAGEADPETADDGTASRPWRVMPEFELIVQTRAATNAVTQLGTELESGVRSRLIDLGPTGDTSVTSTLSVTVFGGATDHTARFDKEAEYGNVPEAVWKVLPLQPDVAEERVIRTCTGVRYQAVPTFVAGAVVIDVAGVEVGTKVHPLPFGAELKAAHALFPELRDLAEDFAGQFAGASTADVLEGVRDLVHTAPLGDVRLTDDRLDAGRAAAPRLVSLAQGIAELERPVVDRKDREVPPIVVVEPVVTPPLLEGVLRAGAPAAGAGGGWLVAGASPATSVGSATTPRQAPPTLAAVRTGLALRLGAELVVAADRTRVRRGTLQLDATPPATLVAGTGSQRVLRGGSDPSGRKLASATSRRLLQQGVTVRAGDVQVWRRDGSEFDEPDGRPLVRVAGTARVVVLDRGGRTMVDAVMTDASVEVPVGAARLAVAGGNPGGGAAGWTSTEALAEVADGTWLGPRTVIRTGGSSGRARAARSSVARAGRALLRSGRVATELAGAFQTVVVAFDGAGDDLPLVALEGAERAGTTTAVREGGRTILVTPVKPTAPMITVGIAPNGGAALAGVIGSPLDAATVAATVATDGLAAVAPTSPPGGTVTTITWEEPQ